MQISANAYLQIFITILLAISMPACNQKIIKQSERIKSMNTTSSSNPNDAVLDTATFAAGCFWCVEAQFQMLQGVHTVKSGYTGGAIVNPTYEQVCTGQTGHAEAVNIVYDPTIISYQQLLAAYFLSHDPTQLNRQGNDIGTQYRSAIFPRNEAQEQIAKEYIASLNKEKVYQTPIVTTIEPFSVFYDAENYHDNYYQDNPQNPYCQMVVKPKVEKFEKVFKDVLKKDKSNIKKD